MVGVSSAPAVGSGRPPARSSTAGAVHGTGGSEGITPRSESGPMEGRSYGTGRDTAEGHGGVPGPVVRATGPVPVCESPVQSQKLGM